MNVLIGCEESQVVCKAFRRRGHNAYSNDIIPCSGMWADWHIQGDFLNVARFTSIPYKHPAEEWDLIISFPPCTHLAVSGARWFKKKRLSGEQDTAIKFFLDCWDISNAVENPIGIMSGNGDYIRAWFPQHWQRMQDMKFPLKPTQIIQPWQFGHGETKATCLWLNGVNPLVPTDIVPGREQRIWKMGPSEDRGKERSKTYPGIAKAMAYQWG